MRFLSVLLGLCALPLTVSAHHSRASFLLGDTMLIEGTVTELSWRNPHLYLTVSTLSDQDDEDSWTLEGHSIPGLARLGWYQDSVKIGDQVVVVVNPNKDRELRYALIDSITTSAGDTYYAFRIPEDVALPQEQAQIEPSTDFSGTWVVDRTLRETLLGGYEATEWPVTELGQKSLDEYDPAENPYFECIPSSLPRGTDGAYPYSWERSEDQLIIRREHHLEQNRVLDFNDPLPPEDYVPSLLGYSVARFEDDGTLIVETTGFAQTRWGIARSIDSSVQKHLIERYELTNGGLSMSLSYTVEDPVYLTEPKTVTVQYRKIEDYDFTEEPPCDTEAAQRHLEFEK